MYSLLPTMSCDYMRHCGVLAWSENIHLHMKVQKPLLIYIVGYGWCVEGDFTISIVSHHYRMNWGVHMRSDNNPLQLSVQHPILPYCTSKSFRFSHNIGYQACSAHLPHSQKENDMLGWMQVHPLYRMITGYIVCIWTKSIICHVVMEHQHYMPLAPWTHSDIHQDFRLDGIVHSSNRSKVV